MSKLIEVLTHYCAACSEPLQDGDRVHSIYPLQDVRDFTQQVELGIIGNQVRNYWAHLYCKNTKLRGYALKPDLHTCIECKRGFEKQDLVVPVFQVTNPRAINPHDPSDIGIELGERVYMVHHDCRNKALSNSNTNILYKP